MEKTPEFRAALGLPGWTGKQPPEASGVGETKINLRHFFSGPSTPFTECSKFRNFWFVNSVNRKKPTLCY